MSHEKCDCCSISCSVVWFMCSTRWLNVELQLHWALTLRSSKQSPGVCYRRSISAEIRLWHNEVPVVLSLVSPYRMCHLHCSLAETPGEQQKYGWTTSRISIMLLYHQPVMCPMASKCASIFIYEVSALAQYSTNMQVEISFWWMVTTQPLDLSLHYIEIIFYTVNAFQYTEQTGNEEEVGMQTV